MASRRKIVALSLTVSLVGLLGIYVYAWSVSPRDARISDIGQDDIGAFMRIRAHIRSVVTVGSGGIRIDLLDYADRSSISGYIPEKVFMSLGFRDSLRPGAFIEIAGEIQEFKGEVEISASDGRMVRLLEMAAENRLGLGVLARNPGTFSGMSVAIRGSIESLESIVDWSKLLAVAGPDKMWVDYGGGGNFGGKIDIFGAVLFNEGRKRYEIRVAGGNDSISPHGRAPPSGYQEVTLGVLAGNPTPWEGRFVAVIGVTALAGEVIGTSFSLSDFEEDDYYTISCMLFGWDWSTDGRGISNGTVAEFGGIWGYYATKAQWQVTSDVFTIRA